ncbi:predicted protein [Histoplasma mississippiense (nom. inval.)]|nr:predicted protein [Histoplasma mississippiense (nom. inval.)]EDN06255.1 predicted protein [Histoplasma mississippiense (nom. inval.)]
MARGQLGVQGNFSQEEAEKLRAGLVSRGSGLDRRLRRRRRDLMIDWCQH